ncbi:MAG: hypothetical protein QOJ54_3502 [Aliidongia sp.]|jgi:hypothetical protein|nr:hypothetical protein [Aliidongia sp.]
MTSNGVINTMEDQNIYQIIGQAIGQPDVYVGRNGVGNTAIKSCEAWTGALVEATAMSERLNALTQTAGNGPRWVVKGAVA